MTAELVVFLRARLNEIEDGLESVHDCNCAAYTWESRGNELDQTRCDCGWTSRLLVDIEVKRQIVNGYARAEARADARLSNGLSSEPADEVGERLALQWCCQMLALTDAGHPDYREAWKP